MWLAIALFLVVGVTLIGLGFIVYLLLFAELSRRRHHRSLTAEWLSLYLFGYGGVMVVLVFLLSALEGPGLGFPQLFGLVIGTIALTTALIVMWRRRSPGTMGR
jgi:multisubunit Na+/H+ antiporter MnhB subunit